MRLTLAVDAEHVIRGARVGGRPVIVEANTTAGHDIIIL